MHPDATPRWGINSQTTPRASIDEFVRGAGAAELRHVELAADILTRPTDELLELLDTSGVAVLGVCPSGALLDWHRDGGACVAQHLEGEIIRAAELGAEYFVLPFMRTGGSIDSVRAGLARAVPIARAHGVRLAVEPIGHVGLLRRAEELAPLLVSQDLATVGLLLDSFHFFRAGHVLEDVGLYDDVPILALQISNINDVPLDEAVGYRDRRFPLDGRMPVPELCARVLTERPATPLVVEVIGDVASATPTTLGMRRARAQLDQIQNLLTTSKAERA